MGKIEVLREQTFQETCALLDEFGKCAVIRPTGFGKTGILTRIIRSGRYKKILYLYPAEVVRSAVFHFYYGPSYHILKNGSIPNVTFMTYKALTSISEKQMAGIKGTDLIICDECHRLGAPETMVGMYALIRENPEAHLLGATATPERMDMIDEIALFFDDHTTSRYTLHDAIQDGIIQKPYYCFCSYGDSNPDALARIKKNAMLQVEGLDDRESAIELLNSRMIEIAELSKMETAIKSTLEEANTDTTYQKYIVFFSDFGHMRDAKKRVYSWFHNLFPSHDINELIVTSETSEYIQNARKLDSMAYRENTIDLIYTCEMLNLGYHVGDLTGILMYRGTSSSIVYVQQLGRALSTGDSRPKVVLDIVDNIHRESMYAIMSEKFATPSISEAEMHEYIELVHRTHDKDSSGHPIPLTEEESNRLIELKKLIRNKGRNTYKRGYSLFCPEDLIVTAYSATYRELMAKVVAEPLSMRCRQAWNRWVEKGGDISTLTREYILNQQAPEAVPLAPFCRLKNVSVNAVLDAMGISA